MAIPHMQVYVPACDGDFFIIPSEETHHYQELYGKNHSNVELLVSSWTVLLADSPLLDLKPLRVIRRFHFGLAADLFGYIKLYSSLAHTLLSTLYVQEDATIDIPYIKAFEKTPIYREYVMFRKTGNSSVLQYILSFLRFGSKLYYEDETFSTTAFRKWCDVEDRISAIKSPEWVTDLSRYVRFLMKTWDSSVFLPVHGGGAVSEHSIHGISAKNHVFDWDAELCYMYEVRDDLRRSPHPLGYSRTTADSTNRTSRLMFVPKDWKTARSICMEPVVFLWAQQGVRLWLENAIKTGPLQSFVKIKDQNMNRSAAEFGSITQLVDTIDLSSASDSVRWDLIKETFPAQVRMHLSLTRTHRVLLPDGSERSVAKFAPMGSAVCFPTQTILYSAVCLMEYDRYTGLDSLECISDHIAANLSTANGTKLQPFRVYGDDIVCDTRITSNIIERLQQLGFEVNVSKSFTGTQAFRESCGGWFFLGHDVTPFHFKTKSADGAGVSVDFLSSLIDNANLALDMCYTNLNLYLRSVVHSCRLTIAGRQVLSRILEVSSDSDESFALRCDNPDNSNLRERLYDGSKHDDSRFWLQRDEIYSMTPKLLDKESFHDGDEYLLGVWYRSKYPERGIADEGQRVPRYDPQRTGVGWRWTPSQK